MKNIKLTKFHAILFTSFIFNTYIFLVNYFNYNSTRGTDYNKYGPYLDFYTFGLDSPLQEQGVGYFWFISYISKLKINSLKISPNFESLIHNFGIQIGNYIFFIIGCIGIYFLLRYLKISPVISLVALNMLAIFPPILGARLILKPEIMMFAYLPWIILCIYKFLDTDNLKYLYLLIPMTLVVVSSKASLALMLFLAILTFFHKQFLKIKVIVLAVPILILFLLLIYESFLINSRFVWEHTTPNGYDNVANLKFLFSLNSDLFLNPYRDSQATSMFGILFLDTFGDYWQRYWFHKDGWLNNQYPGNINLIRVGMFLSVLFYVFLVYFLYKESNKKLKRLGGLSIVGVIVLLITIFNIFPFLTKNFNPSKGDPIKTHYFSFFLALSFAYLKVKLLTLKSFKNFGIFFLILYFLTTLQIYQSSSIEDLAVEQSTLNKLHLLSPCLIGDPVRSFIYYPDGWCTSEEISKSICDGQYDKSLLPITKDDYLVFPPDELYIKRNLIFSENTVTVSNYYECLNYADGGFIKQSSEKYFFNNEREIPNYFLTTFVASLFAILYLIIFERSFKTKKIND
tara:strand:+ start:1767 stop:3476 length:1710 start_codon:yes stop_codon:yes gene_type:complete